MPADDLTDPAPATTFAHLDATTVLSRGIAELGIYPAVDPLDSTSRILDPNVVGQEHYDIARSVQKLLQVSLHALPQKTVDKNSIPHWRPLCLTALLISKMSMGLSFIAGLQVTAGYHCYPWYG